ncbi:MAG: hypothetical protein PF518_04925 [Spirochaetaceae bacterium]|jgi:hypothetical protein|nr:hypothetical protein [Spirochaetaceae bacterium]
MKLFSFYVQRYNCAECKKCIPEGLSNIGKRVNTPKGKGTINGLDLPCSPKVFRYMVKMDKVIKPAHTENSLSFWKKEITFLEENRE